MYLDDYNHSLNDRIIFTTGGYFSRIFINFFEMQKLGYFNYIKVVLYMISDGVKRVKENLLILFAVKKVNIIFTVLYTAKL